MARAVSLFHETAPDELKTMRLGGGTALAAMWHHRMSTDIDLACWETTFDVLRADGLPLQVALLRLHSEGRIPRPTFAARMIAWEYPSEVAEGQGFEPWEALPSLVFKTSAFDHSATPPEGRLPPVEAMRFRLMRQRIGGSDAASRS